MNEILHNTTFAVDAPLVDSFLEFVRGRYIPAMRQAGAASCLLARMAPGPDMPPCFALQHRRSVAVAAAVDEAADALKAEMTSRWADGVVWFDSVLEVIEETDRG